MLLMEMANDNWPRPFRSVAAELLKRVAPAAVGCDGSLPPAQRIEVASYLNAERESLRSFPAVRG
jgi:hypothetical protein